jgi:hypothetical protein
MNGAGKLLSHNRLTMWVVIDLTWAIARDWRRLLVSGPIGSRQHNAGRQRSRDAASLFYTMSGLETTNCE